MKSNGFTFLEILVVMAMMATMGIAGVITYGRVQRQEEMTAVVVTVAEILARARVGSVSGDKDTSWRVDLLANKAELKDGLGNLVVQYSLPARYSLSSPVSQVEFGRGDGRGAGCESGCLVTVSQLGGSLSQSFRILYSGVVEY